MLDSTHPGDIQKVSWLKGVALGAGTALKGRWPNWTLPLLVMSA